MKIYKLYIGDHPCPGVITEGQVQEYRRRYGGHHMKWGVFEILPGDLYKCNHCKKTVRHPHSC